MSVWSILLLLLKVPTAQTLLEPGTRATPARELSFDPTLGLGTTFQLVLFHCSVSVWSTLLLLTKVPTTQMSLAETAVTPESELSCEPMLGLGTTFQLVPFHCSISVRSFPLLLTKSPTAQTLLEPGTRTTPESELSLDPTLGLGTTLQLEPFHCSVRVCRRVVLLLMNCPTAQTELSETAVTPKRRFAPETLGLGTTLQLAPFHCSVSVCSFPNWNLHIYKQDIPQSTSLSSVLEVLTSREREVLILVAEGHTNQEIATHLNLSIKTVQAHRANVMEKLGLHDVTHLVRFAIQHGLIPAES